MANTPVTGGGPFEYITASGKQVSIPLSALSFDASGNPVVDAAWTPLADPGTALLAFATAQGTLAPAATRSPFPAMLLRAADAGASGNNITVTVAVSSPPANGDITQTTFDLTVTETDVYKGLTAATVESILGSSAVTGTSPGLVQVVAGSVDAAGVPTAVAGAALTGSPAKLDVDGTGTPPLVFSLTGKKDSPDALLTKVSVTPTTGSSFDLEATWTKTVSGVTLTTVASQVSSELGYEITVSTPNSGAYSLPASAVTALSGGSSVAAASATLFTGH